MRANVVEHRNKYSLMFFDNRETEGILLFDASILLIIDFGYKSTKYRICLRWIIWKNINWQSTMEPRNPYLSTPNLGISIAGFYSISQE